MRMNHTLGAAVIGAMTVIPSINAEELDAHAEKIENKDALNEAMSLMQLPAMSSNVANNMDLLVRTIKQENVSLVELYASVSTGGSSNVLNTDFSSGFSNNNNGGGTFTFVSPEAGDTCHQDCHGDCHGNHSSRGWR